MKLSPVLRALVLWMGFPLALAWIVLFRLPWRVSAWALSGGGSDAQRKRRERRRAQQVADWAQIERAMVVELRRRRWPDTPAQRSILLSGRWGRR